MKVSMIKILTMMLMMTAGVAIGLAQTTISPSSDAAAGLDLYAVADLFKNSDNLEKFERDLNAPERGVNNIDLNGNGEIDFIRISEKVTDQTHLIILQVALGKDEFQDVATIAVERENGENYNLQLQGDPGLYGESYYVVPANNDFRAWNVVRWLFTPNYHPYYSAYGYKTLPNWWIVRRPTTYAVYQSKVALFPGRSLFVASKTLRVKTIAKVDYHPRTSTLVVKKVSVTRNPGPPARPVNGGRITITKTTTTVVRPRKKP